MNIHRVMLGAQQLADALNEEVSTATADEGSTSVDLSEVLDPLFMSILNSIAPTVSISAGGCENKEQRLLEETAKELDTPPSANSTLIPSDAGTEEYTPNPEISLYQDLAVSAPAYPTSFNPRKHQLCPLLAPCV